MALSPKARYRLQRIIPFGLIWLLIGWVFIFVEHTAVDSADGFRETAIRINWKVFIFASIAVTIVGLIIGYIELVFLDHLFSRKRFLQKIIYKILTYLLIFSVLIAIVYPIAASLEIGLGLFDPIIWKKSLAYHTSLTHLSTIVQMMVSLLLSLFYAEVSGSIGHKMVHNFFVGKYHQPIEEERIFMFLDMKGSTTIAEEIGHNHFFQLLKAYYADISDAVILHGGEIYQYVGDEIIVSWDCRFDESFINSVHCFFEMKKALTQKSDWYLKEFGLIPTFKAGIHYGKVTSGEIGVLKKDIFFTGDVLNVTARIQGLCNQYRVDLLISDDMASKLSLQKAYALRAEGSTKLRGRAKSMVLHSVHQKK